MQRRTFHLENQLMANTIKSLSDYGVSTHCVYRKLKPERIGDEVRPGWRVKL
jgi:hypothetical protein